MMTALPLLPATPPAAGSPTGAPPVVTGDVFALVMPAPPAARPAAAPAAVIDTALPATMVADGDVAPLLGLLAATRAAPQPSAAGAPAHATAADLPLPGVASLAADTFPPALSSALPEEPPVTDVPATQARADESVSAEPEPGPVVAAEPLPVPVSAWPMVNMAPAPAPVAPPQPRPPGTEPSAPLALAATVPMPLMPLRAASPSLRATGPEAEPSQGKPLADARPASIGAAPVPPLPATPPVRGDTPAAPVAPVAERTATLPTDAAMPPADISTAAILAPATPAPAFVAERAQPTLDLSQRRWVHDLAGQVADMIGREGQARIALSPERLGPLTIALTDTADGLSLRLEVATPAAEDALKSAEARLVADVRAAGGRIADSQVVLAPDTPAQTGTSWGGGQQGGQRPAPAQPEPLAGRTPPPPTDPDDRGTAADPSARYA